MRATRAIIAVLVLATTVTACATREWYAESHVCRAAWTQRIPEVWQQRIVERTRYETVPDGNIRCTSAKDGPTTRTHCTQGERNIAIPYATVETFDLNRAARAPHIDQCIAENCARKYGNAACEIG